MSLKKMMVTRGLVTGIDKNGILPVSETIASIVTGFIGLALGLFIVRLISERLNANKEMAPKISEIVFSASDSCRAAIHIKNKMNTCTECRLSPLFFNTV